jgi:diphthamide synthase (EF-2-diphthine--ammonia ligase)
MEANLRLELASLRAEGFTGVVFGDIHLADVRAWYEDRVTAAGLEHVEPIWGQPPQLLLDEFIASGGRAVITCVELAKLDEAWLGRVIDERFASAIANTAADPCGENGEYHSFAFAGPVFKKPLAWIAGERRLDSGFAQLDLTQANA